MQRTACSFVVPIHVPAGYQISVIKADWRGFAEGSTELFREYFFADSDGVKNDSSPSGNYTEQDEYLTYETVSACGEDIALRINSSVRATDSDSYIAVDSVDIKNSLEFHLEWKKCGQSALPYIMTLLL